MSKDETEGGKFSIICISFQPVMLFFSIKLFQLEDISFHYNFLIINHGMKISLFINLIYIFKMSKVRCFWERKHVRDYCNTVYYFTFGMYPKFITCLILFCLFWAMALLPWLLAYCYTVPWLFTALILFCLLSFFSQ